MIIKADAQKTSWWSSFFVESSGRSPGLDVLRAAAILMVLLRHFLDRNIAYDPFIPYIITRVGLAGWAGVDLFYVLSGFLIFRILFLQQERGTYSARAFYTNRILRIWPAYFASLFVCLVIGQFSGANIWLLKYFVIFFQNYIPGFTVINGGIYWSIAVEEHFYMLAPLLIFVTGGSRPRRLGVLVALVLIPLLIRIVTYEFIVRGNRNAFYTYIYFPTHERFDCIVFGILCAYVATYRGDLLKNPRAKWLLPALWIAIQPLWWTASAPLSEYLQQPSLIAGALGFWLTAAFWATTLLIVETYGILNWLGKGVMRVVAHLSFSMYLYHMLCLELTDRWFAGLPATHWTILGHAIVFVSLTVLASICSYVLVERRFLIMKQRLKTASASVSIA